MRIIQEPGEPFSISYDPDEKDLNVNGTVHGGIIFYLCDEAIGRYMTALGKKGAAADADIHFYRPAFPGNRITVTVTERKAGRRLGVYLIEAKNAAPLSRSRHSSWGKATPSSTISFQIRIMASRSRCVYGLTVTAEPPLFLQKKRW